MGLAVLTGTPPGNRPRSKDEGLRFFLLLRHRDLENGAFGMGADYPAAHTTKARTSGK